MAKAYKGLFTQFNNPQKYRGDINNCIYRSSWERAAFRWCDLNTNIVEWASEELYFYYTHPITNKRVKYYPDLFIKTRDGKVRIVEIKPQKQTSPPLQPHRKTQKYMNEVTTYMVNQTKWEAAEAFCKQNKLTFEVWTENNLRDLGIMNLKADGKTLLGEKGLMKKKSILRNVKRPKRKS